MGRTIRIFMESLRKFFRKVVFQWLQEKFKPIEWESVDNTEVEPEIEQYTRK